MKSIVRKMGIVLLALVTTLAFMFVLAGINSTSGNNGGVDTVYAGGSYSIPEIEGKNSDGTVDVNGTLMVSMAKLNQQIPEFQSKYWNNKVRAYWEVDGEEVAGTYDSGFFKLKIIDSYAGKKVVFYTATLEDDTSYNNNSEKIQVNKKETSGGSGSGSGGSGETGITDIKGPTINSFTATTAYVPLGSAKFSYYINYGTYKEGGYSRTSYDTVVELYRNGTKVKEDTRTNSSFVNPVSYGKADTFVLKTFTVIDGKRYAGQTASKTIRSIQMGRTQVRATRINAKQAVVRWNIVDGATGYRIVKGKKKVKDVRAAVTKYVVKGKGAGNAKYRVLPLRKSEGKVYAGVSVTAKPKANSMKTSKPTSWKGYKYGRSRFVVKSISLNGRMYTVKGLFYNSAHYIKVKKYKKMTIKIYADGKRVASKKYRNVSVNLKAKSTKKRTYKIRGKAGADLKYGNAYAVVSVTTDDPFFNTKGKITWTDYGH